jgi:hypothetical protein
MVKRRRRRRAEAQDQQLVLSYLQAAHRADDAALEFVGQLADVDEAGSLAPGIHNVHEVCREVLWMKSKMSMPCCSA